MVSVRSHAKRPSTLNCLPPSAFAHSPCMKRLDDFGITPIVKNALCFVFVLVTGVASNAAVEQEIIALWDKTYGGNSADYGLAMYPTADGGLVLGGFSSTGIDGTKTSPFYGGVSDYWLVKVDANGNQQWDRSYGGTGEDVLFGITQMDDGGFVLAGYSDSVPSGNKSAPKIGSTDGWVVRTDAAGNKLWDVSLGSTKSDSFEAILKMPDGGVLCGGTKVPDPGVGAYWLVRLDTNGAVLWERTYGGTGYQQLRNMLIASDGNILLGGSSNAKTPSGNKTSAGFGAEDMWIIKVDTNGVPLWDKSFGGTNTDYLVGMCNASDGGFLLTGSSASPTNEVKSSPHFGSSDWWVLKIDAAGGKVWDNSFGTTTGENTSAIVQKSDGTIIVAGSANAGGSGGNRTAPFVGALDGWSIVLDANGNKLGEGIYAGSGGAGDTFNKIFLCPDGSMFFNGQSESVPGPYKSAPLRGGWDVSLVKAVTRIAPVGMPVIRVNGIYHPDNLAVIEITPTARMEIVTRFPNGIIFYSVDGSDPNSGLLYNGAFTVSRSATIRAVAYRSDFSESAEADSVRVIIPPPRFLSASTPGGGTVNVTPQQASYLHGTPVTVQAAPDPGWRFLGWTGDAAGTNPVVATSMTRNKCLQAIFGTTVSAAVAGNGILQQYPEAAYYPYGTEIQFNAIPNSGSFFSLWSSAASGDINPLKFTVSAANPSISCLFQPLAINQFALAVSTEGLGSVSITPRANRYPAGSSVTVTAAPSPDQRFLAWSGSLTGTVNPATLIVDTNKTVTAHFTRKPRLNAVSCLGSLSNEGFQMNLTGNLGAGYLILATEQLEPVPLTWTPLVVVTNSLGTTTIIDFTSTNSPRRFYRAIEQ